MLLAKIAPEYWLFGGATLVSVIAFATLILAPVLHSYGRGWEKAAATVASVFVLAALILVGVAIGVGIVYYYNDIVALF